MLLPQEAVIVRRLCILYFLVALWPGLALAQSPALMEVHNKFTALYEQGRYAEAEPFAVEVLSLKEAAFAEQLRRLYNSIIQA